MLGLSDPKEGQLHGDRLRGPVTGLEEKDTTSH